MNGYVDGNDKSINQMMEHWYQAAYTQNLSWQTEAMIDTQFKVGDPRYYANVFGDSRWNNAQRFSFNLINRATMMIEGYQRQHRKSTAVIPTSDNTAKIATQATKLSMYSQRREHYHNQQSVAFGGAVTCGLNLMEMVPDYTSDPVSGDLITNVLGFSDFIIDPYWKKPDLSDCNFLWKREWITKEVAKRRLPERAEEIDKMRPNGRTDAKFPNKAEMLQSSLDNLFSYDIFYYLDSREATVIVDTKSGETSEWEELPDDADDELERTLAVQPWLATTKIHKPTVKMVIKLGDRVMYDGPNWLKVDRFPAVPIVCYKEDQLASAAWRTRGIVRNLRDAQFLYNRRKIIELDILESQLNSGYMYVVGSVDDEESLRATGQGQFIPVQTSLDEIQAIQPPAIPQSMMELSRGLAEDITKISGVSEELLGAAEDDQAGILSMLRQAANLTTLQTIFDNLDTAQVEYERLRQEAIRKNWSRGKCEAILNEQLDPRYRLSVLHKYDIAVEQAAYSTTQQQLEFKQKVYLRELGVPIPDEELIKSATLQGKDELIAAVRQQAEQQQQVQQQQMQMQQEEANRKRMLDFSKAQSDMASARDKQASAAQKIVSLSEIQARAERDQTQSDLNLVKQMIELEDMDLRQVRQSLELAEYIKQTQQNEVSYEIQGPENAQIQL